MNDSPKGIVLSIAGTFAGMPAAFTFLAIAWYGNGGPLFWILGAGSLAFGLFGMWQLMLGARTKPGKD